MFFRREVGRDVARVAVMLRELVGVLGDNSWAALAGGDDRGVD